MAARGIFGPFTAGRTPGHWPLGGYDVPRRAICIPHPLHLLGPHGGLRGDEARGSRGARVQNAVGLANVPSCEPNQPSGSVIKW